MIPDELTVEECSGRGGEGGRGGHGGEGGASAGNGITGLPGNPGKPGEPGEPGKPGEPGEWSRRERWSSGGVNYFALLASSGTLIVAVLGGIYWLIGLEYKIAAVSRDLATFREAVMSLNTPLSQHVFALEARVGEIARIQSEVRASVASMDANGTSQIRVLRRDIDSLHSEQAVQDTRDVETRTTLGKLNNDVIETRIRLQYLIEAVTPHLQGPQKKQQLKE